MHNEQTAGSGECDVQQAQALPSILGVAGGLQIGAVDRVLAANIQDSSAVGVMAAQECVFGGFAAVPRERYVDDRELQALTAVHGQHLHGLGVRLQSAGQLGGRHALLCPPDLIGQPVRQGDRPGMGATLVGVQKPGDVAQVSELSFPVRVGKDPGCQMLVAFHKGYQFRDAALIQCMSPLAQLL